MEIFYRLDKLNIAAEVLFYNGDNERFGSGLSVIGHILEDKEWLPKKESVKIHFLMGNTDIIEKYAQNIDTENKVYKVRDK